MFAFSDRKSIFFNSHNVSKPESSSVLTEVCPCRPGGWCEPGAGVLLGAGPRVELARGQGQRGLPGCPGRGAPETFVLTTCVPRPAHHQVRPGGLFQLFPRQEELDTLLLLI